MAGRRRAPPFWERVHKTETCWFWTGPKTKDGYGCVRVGGSKSNQCAHRVAYEMTHGTKIPAGLQIDHLCRVHSCVNPAHLEVVTQEENQRRGRGVKLKLESASEIKRLCDEGYPKSEVARMYGVTRQNIQHICNGRQWRDA